MAEKFIEVTGVSTDTEPHELIKLFSKFGVVQVIKMNSGTAIIHFNHEHDKRKALENDTIVFNDKILKIKPINQTKALKGVTNANTPVRHKYQNRQRHHAFTGTQYADDIIHPTKIDLTGDFFNQMRNILANVCLTREEVGRTALLYEHVQSTLQQQWPDCKTFAFGSTTTGLGIKSSDADCFVSLPQVRDPGNPYNIVRARNILAKRPDLFTELVAIPQANTPIVKFLHKPTQMRCDVSMKNCLSLRNSELIKFLLHTDERLLNIAIILKYWGKIHGLTGTGRLSNYALVIMYIFYLQQQHVSLLPSIRALKSYPVFVECWDTGFTNNPLMLPRTFNKIPIPELLGGFFQYYGSFNYSKYVISPYMGIPIEKERFQNDNLPEGFELYKENINNKYCLPLKVSSPICVQDPFEQSRNISTGVYNRLAVELQKYFQFASEAYNKAKPNNHLEFLRTILLSKPRIVSQRDVTCQVMVPTRFLLIPPTEVDWQSRMQNVIETIFGKILKIKLYNQCERKNDRRIHITYKLTLDRCPWSNRLRFENAYDPKAYTFFEIQQKITDRVLAENLAALNSTVTANVLMFSFNKVITSYNLVAGEDYDAFKDFCNFLTKNFAVWCRELLRAEDMLKSVNNESEGTNSPPHERLLKSIEASGCEDSPSDEKPTLEGTGEPADDKCENKIPVVETSLKPLTAKSVDTVNENIHAVNVAKTTPIANEIPPNVNRTHSPAADSRNSPHKVKSSTNKTKYWKPKIFNSRNLPKAGASVDLNNATVNSVGTSSPNRNSNAHAKTASPRNSSKNRNSVKTSKNTVNSFKSVSTPTTDPVKAAIADTNKKSKVTNNNVTSFSTANLVMIPKTTSAANIRPFKSLPQSPAKSVHINNHSSPFKTAKTC